jgi:hypothetical protein
MRRTEDQLRREANMRKLYDNTLAADTNGRHGQSIYEIQKAVQQIEDKFRTDGMLKGPHREAALKTVVGGYLSNSGFDPEIIDGDTPRSQVRFKQMLYDADDRGNLQQEVEEQAAQLERDAQQARGGSRVIQERMAASPER